MRGWPTLPPSIVAAGGGGGGGGGGALPPIVDISTVSTNAPTLTAPGYLSSVSEPTYGTKITRISQTSDTNDHHHYSKNQPWNSDMTRMWLGESFLNPATYAKLGTIGDNSSKALRRWSNINPNRFWGPGGSSSNRMNFYRYDLTGATSFTTTSVFNYSGEWDPSTNRLDIGAAEGNLSDDDSRVVLMVRNQSTGVWHTALLVNPLTGAEISRMSVPSDVDWMGVSHSGTHVIAGLVGGHFDLYGQNLAAGGTRIATGVGGHADFVMDAGGNEYLVTVDTSTDRIWKHSLPGGGSTTVLQLTNISGHISGRCSGRPGEAAFNFRKAGPAFQDLIGTVDVNHGVTTEFRMWGYTRTTGVGTAQSAEGQGPVSRDGAKIVFRSNWGTDNGPVYSYLIEVAT